MSIKLDWQQDLENEGWPRRADSVPPRRSPPRWLRWLLLIMAALAVGAGVAFWRMHNSGLSAAKEDVQEAVAYGHWALQQEATELFRQHLDPADSAWQDAVMEDLAQLTAVAHGGETPQVENIRLLGQLAEIGLRWTDPANGKDYLSRRWYRLVDGEWRWTRPRTRGWELDKTATYPHLTVRHATPDGPIVSPLLDRLDNFTAALCERYGLGEAACSLVLQWQLLDDAGLPLTRSDQPLPALAAATADEMDGPVYLLGVDADAWDTAEVRRELERFHPGRVYVAQSMVEMLRPAEADGLPEGTLGEASHPIVLPSPWLTGVADDSAPHPRWQAQAERAITDAILRRSHGAILGSAEYVNGAWALHQALLALEQGIPQPAQIADSAVAAPSSAPPLTIPTLDGLGAVLQSGQDEMAVRQLAGLVAYLNKASSEAEQVALARAIGREPFLTDILSAALGVDEVTFLQGWREADMADPGSPLSQAVNALEDHARREAEARVDRGLRNAAPLFTDQGLVWLQRATEDLLNRGIEVDEQWQVQVTALGTVDDVVWVELEESDSRQRIADLRFYRWDRTEGWQRDRPATALWQEARQLSTGLAEWQYFAADEAVVQAVAPVVDGYIRQVRADLDLPSEEPVRIRVSADTLLPPDPLADGALTVPSPHRARLDVEGDPYQAALRGNVGLLLAYADLMNKAMNLQKSDQWIDAEWPAILGIWRAELEGWGIQAAGMFDQMDIPMARAVAAGTPPSLVDVLSTQPRAELSVEGNMRVPVAMYIVQVHGRQWIGPMLDQGLGTTVNMLLEELGWSLEELEVDWHRFLDERSQEPLLETFRTF